MTKVFLDSNIWIRPLVEKTLLAQQCLSLFQNIDQGLLLPYTSTIVLLETYYVLVSFYGRRPIDSAQDIQRLQQTKNLVLIEKTSLTQALSLFNQTKVKLTDCIIAAQVPPKTIFVTWDKDFQKFPSLSVKTPAQLLQTYQEYNHD